MLSMLRHGHALRDNCKLAQTLPLAARHALVCGAGIVNFVATAARAINPINAPASRMIRFRHD